MGPAYFVIAILGCGEGNAPCQEVRVAETRYESEAACSDATDAALMRNVDIAFPVVVAQCKGAGAADMVLPSSVKLPEGREAPRERPKFASANGVRKT